MNLSVCCLPAACLLKISAHLEVEKVNARRVASEWSMKVISKCASLVGHRQTVELAYSTNMPLEALAEKSTWRARRGPEVGRERNLPVDWAVEHDDLAGGAQLVGVHQLGQLMRRLLLLLLDARRAQVRARAGRQVLLLDDARLVLLARECEQLTGGIRILAELLDLELLLVLVLDVVLLVVGLEVKTCY